MIASRINIVDAHIASWRSSPFAKLTTGEPWEIAADLEGIVARLLKTLGTDYEIEGGIAVHRTAVVETGAVMKAPP